MLTGLQRTTLSDVGNGSVYKRKFGHGAWRIMGGNPAVIGRLVSLGYLKWSPSDGERADALLTDAGRHALDGTPIPTVQFVIQPPRVPMIGDRVVFDDHGKLRLAVAGVDTGGFTIPPDAVIDGQYLRMPAWRAEDLAARGVKMVLA